MKSDYIKHIPVECFWKKINFIFNFTVFSLKDILKVNDTLPYLKQSCT